MAGSETLNAAELTAAIKNHALELGFSLVGICSSAKDGDKDFYNWWVDQGFAADMHYLRAQKEKRQSLEKILPGTKSAVVCALRFPGGSEKISTIDDEDKEKIFGKIARYALNQDYHRQLGEMLKKLAAYIDEKGSIPLNHKSLAYVDTGAIPERSLAERAGLGWVGKNAMLIHPEEGSWFWIGEVITTAELINDQPLTDHCGKCRRCIDACPTGAILEGIRAIDSRKCIAYLNIEHRGPIPKEFHEPMGDWLLGCDICQEVCPWNEHSLKRSRKNIGAPPVELVDVDKILAMSKEEFQTLYKPRAVARAKLSGLKRNAEIIKKNHS